MTIKVLFISDISCEIFKSITDRMMVKGLHQKDVDITVVTSKPTPETIDLEREGIKIIYLPLENKLCRHTRERLRQILLEGCFDILHFTYGKAATIGLLAGRGLNLKIVGYYGSLSLHWYDPSAWFAFLNPRIDKIICPSNAVKAHIKKQLNANRRNRIVRIYRGYDPSWFDNVEPVTRESMGVSPDDFLICTVGDLRKVKGIQYLIKAVEHLPHDMPLKILLVGSGTDSPEIRRLTEATGRPECFLLQGHVPVSPSYIVSCDLYIQPSLSEGLGRAISEAMCLAKPVIVTDGGGAKEFFEDGNNGFVIRRGSHEAITDAIKECYDNRKILHLVGLKARESMLNKFNYRHTVNMTYNLYQELINGYSHSITKRLT